MDRRLARRARPQTLRPQIDAGELRVLAVDSEQRVQGVDAPTMKELGLAGEAVSTLAGVVRGMG